LPTEKLQEAKEKAEAQFNKAKAERLETIAVEGKQLAARKTELENELGALREAMDKLQDELPALEQKVADLKAEIDSIMQGAEPVEVTSEYAQLENRQNAIRGEINELIVNNSQAVNAIQKEVVALSDAITALEQAAAKLEARESGLKRIEELKAEERSLAAEYEELERQIYLTEEFIRTKVELLEGKINSKFRMARFKLFNTLVNGGIEETAETMYNGVPYSNLNNGARIQIGLDIVRTLQAHYGFTCPVWIDNRESIVRLPEMDCQIISLIVSEKDKKLRIELAEKKEMKEVV
jgi:chromosome segregation ATPase